MHSNHGLLWVFGVLMVNLSAVGLISGSGVTLAFSKGATASIPGLKETLDVGPAVYNTNVGSLERCGTVTIKDQVQQTLDMLSGLNLTAPNGRVRRQTGPLQSYSFEVVWHIVASNFSYAGGWVPDSNIDAQMDLLNQQYEGTGISWTKGPTFRIISPFWHERITRNTTGLRFDMQLLLRQGGATTLNVYTLGFPGDNVLGFSSHPANFRPNPIMDGIALRFWTLPGGDSQVKFGGTLTHEAGHWLGLQHTFEGGCDDGIGDGIDDTPAERSPARGCPIGRDSCPDQPGLDPISNHMDYSDDDCRVQFTPGQLDLMHAIIQAFRANPMGR